MQPMSCNEEPTVEREYEVPASPAEVWEELPDVLEGDRVVEECVVNKRLTFWWAAGDNDVLSFVEIELQPTDIGTLLRIRETRVDGDMLVRSAFNARALA